MTGWADGIAYDHCAEARRKTDPPIVGIAPPDRGPRRRWIPTSSKGSQQEKGGKECIGAHGDLPGQRRKWDGFGDLDFKLQMIVGKG